MGLLAKFDWDFFTDIAFSPTGFASFILTTVAIAVAAQFLGVVLGLFSALGWLSHLRLFRSIAYAYVLVVRGTPVLVQIFFVFFGAPLLLGVDLFPRTTEIFGLTVRGSVIAGTVALAINEGAYMSEIIRAGITSIDPGQMEAAKSLGMTRGMAMRRIVLPQAARVIVPPLGNEFNSMLKTTALLNFIGVPELFQYYDVIYSRTFKPAEAFAAAALWYLLLTTLWSIVQAQIERKLGRFAAEEAVEEGWLTRLVGFRRPVREAR